MTLHLAIATAAIAGEGTVVRDIDYIQGRDYAENKDKLDIYVPQGEGPHGVLYFIHGGGLMDGDKKTYGYIGEYFAGQGLVTVVPNYRLSPGVAHPAHIEDVAASFAWVHANIENHGGDPDRILVAGHSAGAYLAALLAADPSYLAAHDLSPADISAVAPISGFYYVERLAPDRPKTVWGRDEADWLAASPAQHASAAVPPILFLYADGDAPERRKESEDMAALLRGKGHASAETQQIAGRNHVSIVRKIGSDGDETTAALLKFARTIADTP